MRGSGGVRLGRHVPWPLIVLIVVGTLAAVPRSGDPSAFGSPSARGSGASATVLVAIAPSGDLIDQVFHFPDGSTFTVRGWLTSKGHTVRTYEEEFGTGPPTLGGFMNYDLVLLNSVFFSYPRNRGYDGIYVDYVERGGGLIVLGQGAVPEDTLDDALGFGWTDPPTSFYVHARIVAQSHPVMSGITELPRAGGVFIDWDSLAEESPLPPGAIVLARTNGTGGYYDPADRIAMFAFGRGLGRVCAGPWDGLARPYGPTDVDPWDVTGYPIVENQLLLNCIRWTAASGSSEIAADIDFDPDTLDPRSRGTWVTVYIELPRGYDPRDLDPSTIRLNGSLAPVLDPGYGFVRDPAGFIVDRDGDGTWERMVKFDRAAVIALLPIGTNPVRIAGGLADATAFAGWSDPVRVLPPP